MPKKSLTLKCDCVAGIKCYTPLKIYDHGDGDVEVNGTYLSKKSVKKLITWLKNL